MSILKNITDFNAPVKAIENRLFEVVKKQYPAQTGVNEAGKLVEFSQPKAYGIYKTTGGAELGTVGERYLALQPNDFLTSFVTGIIENDLDLDLSKLEYREFGEGERISFRLPLEKIAFKNKAKLNDVIDTYLDFTTTFNGTGASKLGIYTRRLVCTNGMMSTEKETYKAYKHFDNPNKKALIHANEIGKIAVEGLASLNKKFKSLDDIEVTTNKMNNLLKKITGYDFTKKGMDEATHKTRTKMVAIKESVDLEISRTGKTLWGVLNGITHYTNHVAPVNTKNPEKSKDVDDYILFASGATLNKKAQDVIMAELVD